MNVMVFDTETTNLEKPFSYNIGYTIVNVETGEKLVNRDFVVEQIWHNLMLFTTAYYADKRSLYVSKMKAKRTIMDKFGYITQQIIRDIKSYEIAAGYAYNSPFDIKVFAFCCDWFKVANPLDLIPVYDIRGYAVEFICNTDEYKAYCEDNQKFTESGNYSTTAEAVYGYISNNAEYIEEHTALEDSLIEADILLYALSKGAVINTEYKVPKSLWREQLKTMVIKYEGEEYVFEYTKKIERNGKIYLK